MIITGRQIRDARSLLRLRRCDLAIRIKTLSTVTIIRAEAVDDEPPITAAQSVAIQSALETAGIEFTPENGGGAGVRLRKSQTR